MTQRSRAIFEGTNVVYEERFPEGQLDRLPGFAAELVGKGVGVIVACGGPPTSAARKATTAIPIAVTFVADPVAIGVAATPERPSARITGATNNAPELAGRHMALIGEVFPKPARVAILSDPGIPGADAGGMAPIERANIAAARAAGLSPQMVRLRGPKPDFDTTFKGLASEGAEASVVLEVLTFFSISKILADFAVVRRLPTMFLSGTGDAGGLLFYGASFGTNFSRMPVYVERIFKGGRPAEMAYEIVSKRELVINLETALALGLSIPA